jgi:intracellular sulfur oxidation DsrE/DsrF family protein
MMDRYDNLSFVACANSIKRLREQGVDVLLIDRTHTRETAIDHFIERLQQGWTYIKI